MDIATLVCREMLPLSAPPTVGVKLTFAPTLCFGAKVTGKVSPLSANPLPFTEACVIVRLVPPVLVRMAGWVCVVPKGTLPRLMPAGFTLSKPGLTAVPDTMNVVEKAVALLAR